MASVDDLFREANARHMAGDFDGAEQRYLELTELQPHFAWHNLGVLYFKLGRTAEAEAAYVAALKAEPGSVQTRHAFGLLLLRQGRYPEGWALYEARRQDMSAKITRPNLPYPEWRGEDLAGKHIVVVREQGFGDQIMFARFIPQLVSRAAKVTYVCSPNLVRVFEGLGAALIPASEAPPPAAADFWIPDCSLGFRLGATLEALPRPPYLEAPPPPTRDGGVGLVWKASTTGFNARNKMLPEPLARGLLDHGLISLDPQDTGAKDFHDTAALIAGLDLVISIDTAVAHLAGAMGKPVWILLPGLDVDWRWGDRTTESQWYRSARLYRHAWNEGWESVVRRVLADLDLL